MVNLDLCHHPVIHDKEKFAKRLRVFEKGESASKRFLVPGRGNLLDVFFCT